MKPIRLCALVLCAVLPFATQAAAPSLAESLKAAGRFSTFLSLQEIAGATQGQRGATQGQRTYFVPNDAAFSKLGAGTLQMLKKHPKRLNAFLQLHTVSSRVMVADMFEPVQGSKKSFQSSEGHVLGFQCNGHTGMHYPQIKAFSSAPDSTAGDFPREIRSSGVVEPLPSETSSIEREIRNSGIAQPPPATQGIKREIRNSGIVEAPPTTSRAWSAPTQGRVGKFQDIVVAEGVVHEIDGVLLADGITH